MSFFRIILVGFAVLSIVQPVSAQFEVKVFYNHSDRLKEKFFVSDSLGMVKEGHYLAYYFNGNSRKQGEYLDNRKIGFWQFYDSSGALVEKYNYELDISLDYNNNMSDLHKLLSGQNISMTFLEEFHQAPHFIGGMDEFKSFISSNLRYPIVAKENGVQGVVVASFRVDTEGNLKNSKIVRSLGSGCDDEVLRVLKIMPQWVPAKKNEKPIEAVYYLPIEFKL